MTFFVNDILKMILETLILQISGSFSRVWDKIPAFSHFLNKFHVFSRHGKVNDKILDFQGFPGRLETLYTMNNIPLWLIYTISISGR